MLIDIETTGLNPLEDRILCISLIKENIVISFIGEDEKKILTDFWETFDGEFVGYNSDTFDIPFIIKRSLINNIKTKIIVESIDIRKVVNCFKYSYNKYEKGKLSDWAKILEIEIKTDNGEKMAEFYRDKRWIDIKAHCEEDIYILKKLVERCEECGVL